MTTEATQRFDELRKLHEAATDRARQQAELNDALDAAKHKLALLETSMRQSDTHRLRTDVERQMKELGKYRFQ